MKHELLGFREVHGSEKEDDMKNEMYYLGNVKKYVSRSSVGPDLRRYTQLTLLKAE